MCSLSRAGGCSFAVTGDMEGKRGGLELTEGFQVGMGKIGARAFGFAQWFRDKIW